MKKKYSLLVLIASTCCLSAQGTFRFANDENSLVTYRNSPVTEGFVQLIWAPVASALAPWTGFDTLQSYIARNPGWQLVEGLKQPIGPLPGRFDAGVVTIPTSTPGQAIDLAVVAWQGNSPSFDEAYQSGANVGVSGKWFVDTGNPNALPNPEAPGQISILGEVRMIVIVPEPSVPVLGLTGLAIAWARRFRTAR